MNRIDSMEVKGLGERVRDLDDRRSIRVRLTEHGREVLDGIFRLHIANAKHMLHPLKVAERAQIASMLRILLESFEDTSLELEQ